MGGKSISRISKARKIKGRTLIFRNAEVSDAEFILSLRTDAKKSKYLMKTSTEVRRQIDWLEEYASKTDQAYFIIEDKDGFPLGTVRIYDAKEDSFCWGSWILKDNVPKSTAIESALMVYSYAVDYLGFKKAHLDIRKGNAKVLRFHETFGAVRVGETDMDYLYEIGHDEIRTIRNKAKMYLPESIVIDNL